MIGSSLAEVGRRKIMGGKLKTDINRDILRLCTEGKLMPRAITEIAAMEGATTSMLLPAGPRHTLFLSSDHHYHPHWTSVTRLAELTAKDSETLI